MSIVQNSPSVALRNRWMRKHRPNFSFAAPNVQNWDAKQAWTIFNTISFRCVQYHQGWSVRSQAVLMALGVLTTSTGCPTNCSRLLSQLFLFVFECLGSMNNFQEIILSVLITSNARPTNCSRILFAGWTFSINISISIYFMWLQHKKNSQFL